MNLSLQQCEEILSVALDHRLRHLKGRLLYDNRDPAVELDKILRTTVDKHVKRKNVNSLNKMLQGLIASFFAVHDEYNFSQYLFDKTGLRITQIPKEHLSQSTRRRLHLSVTGTGDHSITTLQIFLPTDSGIIYSVRGSFPDMKAEWVNNQTIEIEVPQATEEFERVSQVVYHGETIKIIYISKEC